MYMHVHIHTCTQFNSELLLWYYVLSVMLVQAINIIMQLTKLKILTYHWLIWCRSATSTSTSMSMSSSVTMPLPL